MDKMISLSTPSSRAPAKCASRDGNQRQRQPKAVGLSDPEIFRAMVADHGRSSVVSLRSARCLTATATSARCCSLLHKASRPFARIEGRNLQGEGMVIG